MTKKIKKIKKEIVYKHTNVYAKELPLDTILYNPRKTLKEQGLKWQDNLPCQCKICKKVFDVEYYCYMQSKRTWANRNGTDKLDYEYTCKTCRSNGKTNHAWKSGRLNSDGYIMLHKSLVDKKYHYLGRKSYVSEHRYVYAKAKNVILKSYQEVHHKNHIRDDNRIENLELFSGQEHSSITKAENYITKLEKQISELESKLNKGLMDEQKLQQNKIDCNHHLNKGSEECNNCD